MVIKIGLFSHKCVNLQQKKLFFPWGICRNLSPDGTVMSRKAAESERATGPTSKKKLLITDDSEDLVFQQSEVNCIYSNCSSNKKKMSNTFFRIRHRKKNTKPVFYCKEHRYQNISDIFYDSPVHLLR
jgi:hypothetical protein